jgi:hypothetical protein
MDIKNLSYDELILLVDSDDFYNIICNEQMVGQYIAELHKKYCKENNIKPTKIIYSELLGNNTYGSYNYVDRGIYINKKLIDIFEQCKNTNNSFYPYILISTIIHESRHLWQHTNIKKMFDKNVTDREKISLYSIHKQMHEVKHAIKENPSQIKGLIRVKDGINLVKNLFFALELKIEYGNCPCELDAEEEVLKAFMYIYENNLSENSLNILLNYANGIRENEGLWFLSHEYYEDKEKPYDKKAFKVIKSVYMNYLKDSIEEHKKGNHSYSEEKHVFSLFPNMNKVICEIKENGRKVPESTSDSKEIKQLFACSKKALSPKK